MNKVGTNRGEMIYGSAGNDFIDGRGGNDTIDSRNGSDTLIGGSGNDLIDGRGHHDVAVFSGNYANYRVSDNGGGTVIVRDLVGSDGEDTLKHVESLRFADRTIRPSDGGTVDTTAATPSLAVSPATGLEDTAIPLKISAALTDTDGSETLSIAVKGIPSGAALSAGTHSGSTWTLTPAQLAGLKFTPPADATGDFALTVTATSRESNGGDTASASQQLAVHVDPSPTDPGPVLTVGPGQQYTTLRAAIAASHDGDTIQVQAGTYTNDFATIDTDINIVGVGGMVRLVASGSIPNGKAILVTNADVSISNVEFSGAKVADGNGAGIRYQAGDLTIRNSYFHHNENGLLAANNPSGSITIESSEFAYNGKGDGQTHNLYANEVGTLTIVDSYFHDANVGHEIKSRADVTVIRDSRIMEDHGGTASYSIDLPNGGRATIENNFILQGPNSENPAIIAFGEEGSVHSGSSLRVADNTILNELDRPSSVAVSNSTSVTAQITGNDIYGLSAGQVASGPNAQSGNVFLTREPAIDTSHPWQSAGAGAATMHTAALAADDSLVAMVAAKDVAGTDRSWDDAQDVIHAPQAGADDRALGFAHAGSVSPVHEGSHEESSALTEVSTIRAEDFHFL